VVGKVEKTFAIIENGIVTNSVVGDSLAILQSLLPNAELIEVTKENGPAYIGGTFNGDFFVPTKPYDSWIFNEELRFWYAPIDEPEPENGKYPKWNEDLLEWEMVKIPVYEEGD
jgi:hypothetical protein